MILGIYLLFVIAQIIFFCKKILSYIFLFYCMMMIFNGGDELFFALWFSISISKKFSVSMNKLVLKSCVGLGDCCQKIKWFSLFSGSNSDGFD